MVLITVSLITRRFLDLSLTGKKAVLILADLRSKKMHFRQLKLGDKIMDILNSFSFTFEHFFFLLLIAVCHENRGLFSSHILPGLLCSRMHGDVRFNSDLS